MALKVYSVPQILGKPPEDYADIKGGEAFVDAVKAWAKVNGDGPYAGEEVAFPQGDGYARYVVYQSARKLSLIHLPVGDCWSYPHIERLTKTDIGEVIRRHRTLNELFGRRADK